MENKSLLRHPGTAGYYMPGISEEKVEQFLDSTDEELSVCQEE
ncbi:hypothetical protein [Thermoactinomyces mirandus]|nr:hypothetical protein [Thermoactinomyces mirandus]